MSNDTTYLVWSNEHRRWWAAPSGYTRNLPKARRFSHRAAMEICINAIPGTASRMGMLPELPVALADASTLMARFVELYPHDIEEWE